MCPLRLEPPSHLPPHPTPLRTLDFLSIAGPPEWSLSLRLSPLFPNLVPKLSERSF